ncbi:hypothetical protein DXG01_005303, partial [Tephrocybe rancida]
MPATLNSSSATLSSLLSTTSSSILLQDNAVPETSSLSLTMTSSTTSFRDVAVSETLSSPLMTTTSTTLSAHKKEVLTVLSNTIGSLPPLPPLLDVFLGQLPLPPSNINDSGSMVPSQSKRPHDDKKPNPFLDIEAEVDARDEEDILREAEADDEFDDFIDDREDYLEEEPPTKNALNRAEDREDDKDLDILLDDDEEQFSDNEHPPSAHAISHRSLANHNNMEQWRSLLARAHERGRTYKLSDPSDKGLEPLPPPMLYREGYEETAAMVVGYKLLTAGTAWAPSVKSIIGRVSCPTWIFIESSNGAEVSKLCANLSDIYPREIHPIIENLHEYLHEPFVAPKEGDFVHLNSPPLYRGDLAFVVGYNDNNESRWVEGQHRDYSGQGANVLIIPRVERFVNRTKGKGRAGRPSKLLLDAVDVKNPSDFTYLEKRYHDGFLYHVTHDFEPTVPTVEELVLFERCTSVDPQDIVRAQTEIASLRLKQGDRVIVTSGELVGMTGMVTSFSEDANETTVSIDTKEGIMDVVVPPIHLHKAVRVADRVRVVGGAEDGRVGWVVAVNRTELHVLEDKTAQTGYKGIIREILADDEVRVELSTLKREVFHLSQLSNVNDTKLQPLMYKFNAGTFDMPPPAEVIISKSILPLTVSIPIPTGSSVEMAAAWNPSSRTPNPHRKFSPQEPTLAVEIKVLDFVSSLFLNVAPNNAGWSKTVETFLEKQGYKLKTEGSLRKRFRNALVWYNVLQDATTRHIGDVLRVTCSIAVNLDDGKWHHSVNEEFDEPDPFSSPCERARHPSPTTPDNISPQSSQNIHRAMVEDEESDSDNPVPVGSKRRRDEQEVDEAEQNPFADPSARVRPSDYLRSRCPLCFGERDLDAMERYMDALRARKPPPKKTKVNQDNQEDRVEGGLRVPNSVLDGCESGFTAADEHRMKANTQFFDDTALMALLCRDDIVLFLANMCSAGEKQHYVMALVETLFQHLPLEFRLGILYDIGCQVERSCVKWGFLD